MPDWSKKNILEKAIETRLGLMDLLGEDLYKILESGRIKTKMPFGIESDIDFYNSQLNIQKKFGEGYRLDFDINKPSPSGYKDDFRIGVTKKF
jgi:hypothetical protein|tara:strand:- start:186 stop:464 length:279 start_codon:yes stop_codon:yes gene_type:complete